MYEGWRADVIKCRAITEAIIDFGEDDEIEDSVYKDGTHSITPFRFVSFRFPHLPPTFFPPKPVGILISSPHPRAHSRDSNPISPNNLPKRLSPPNRYPNSPSRPSQRRKILPPKPPRTASRINRIPRTRDYKRCRGSVIGYRGVSVCCG